MRDIIDLALIQDPAFIAKLSRHTPASKQDRPLFEEGLYLRQYGIFMGKFNMSR